MLANVLSMSLSGIEGFIVNVEVDINSGMPSWDIVGLPDVAVKESKERVRTAIKNSGYKILSRKIVVNLAPAYTRKGGSSLDLPIAIGVLGCLGNINMEDILSYVFIGELSLDGSINKVNGILPMCTEALKLGIKKVIIPYENRFEVSIIEGLEVYPAKNLNEVINHLNGNKNIEIFKMKTKDLLNNRIDEDIDFSDVKGQENVKRALEIAAAGGHNSILIGSPGTGKTMISRRITTILPDLSFEEALEITKIHSVAGLLPEDNAFVTKRPFRAPHHTTTAVALTGGGKNPKPGEMSLAHYGVLFLDEIPEFDKKALEVMRGPLEDKKVTISRMNCTVTYPCNFMLIASMNPCPCGYANDTKKKCICTNEQITRYQKKISGPLLDRIDLHIGVGNVNYDDFESNKKEEASKEIRQRVNNARKKQKERYKELKINSNSELTNTMIEGFCELKPDAKEMLKNAFEKFGFSARAYSRILKVARTIADLDNSNCIYLEHIAEAIQYRMLDRKYN